MGRGPAKQATPDLFSADAIRDASPSPRKPIPATEAAGETSWQRHILAKNLRHAVKQLSDREIDQLFEVAFDGAKRRGRLPPSVGPDSTPLSRHPTDFATKASSTDKSIRRRMDIAEVSLTRGQLKVVRAAFKAGITPSRIARQFGLSQSSVRKALASDESKR
jgi:DNA-binding CsgD family transcriptional regulator